MDIRRSAMILVASATVVASIAGWESYRPAAYDDGVGVSTIGFGSTKGVQRGDRTDPVRAVQRLARDADETARAISLCIGDVPLYQHEFDAYVSLAYNIGVTAFCGSTLNKKLQQREYEAACNEILRWNRAGGKVLPGLVKRRQSENKQCLAK